MSITRRIPLLITLLIWPVLEGFAQRDKLILRDGTEENVRIVMAKTDSIHYIRQVGGIDVKAAADNQDVYLVKYEKRGNVFYTEEGQQFTGGGDGRIPNGATVIYLLTGREIFAYNLVMDTNSIAFQKEKKKKAPMETLSKDDIFMVVYPDDTRDIINDFAEVKRKRLLAEEEARRKAEEARLAELAKMFPKEGTLTTATGREMTVTVLSENETDYQFKRKDQAASPIYSIKKTNVKEINVKYIGL